MSSSLIAKSRCYWKFVTERLSEPQLLCWEHSRSDELCLDLEQDLRVLLAGRCRDWALGPPCSCSATFLSIFHAATRNGSDRNVCYYSGVFAFQVFFSRVYPRKKYRCRPANHFLFPEMGVLWEMEPFCKGKAETHCYNLILVSSHNISKAEGNSMFLFASSFSES